MTWPDPPASLSGGIGLAQALPIIILRLILSATVFIKFIVDFWFYNCSYKNFSYMRITSISGGVPVRSDFQI
jgi:hypothetical protein